MLPVLILNCIASTADVVLKRPAPTLLMEASGLAFLIVLKSEIKFFTNVVLDGLN